MTPVSRCVLPRLSNLPDHTTGLGKIAPTRTTGVCSSVGGQSGGVPGRHEDRTAILFVRYAWREHYLSPLESTGRPIPTLKSLDGHDGRRPPPSSDLELARRPRDWSPGNPRGRPAPRSLLPAPCSLLPVPVIALREPRFPRMRDDTRRCGPLDQVPPEDRAEATARLPGAGQGPPTPRQPTMRPRVPTAITTPTVEEPRSTIGRASEAQAQRQASRTPLNGDVFPRSVPKMSRGDRGQPQSAGTMRPPRTHGLRRIDVASVVSPSCVVNRVSVQVASVTRRRPRSPRVRRRHAQRPEPADTAAPWVIPKTKVARPRFPLAGP